jgi:hypothetical protein
MTHTCSLATAMTAPQFFSQLTVRLAQLSHSCENSHTLQRPSQVCRHSDATIQRMNASITASQRLTATHHAHVPTQTSAFHVATYPGPFHPHFSRQR